MSAAQELGSSPYVAIDRSDWSNLAKNATAPLSEAELKNIRGLGDFLDLQEVQEVYLPVSKLLSIYAQGTQARPYRFDLMTPQPSGGWISRPLSVITTPPGAMTR